MIELRVVVMRAVLVCACVAWACAGTGECAESPVAAPSRVRYQFYRRMSPAAARRRPNETRRVFGGAVAALGAFPAACVLLDRYWTARCSATVVAPRWALTAAHCVSPHLAYVKYNTRRPGSPDGDIAAVHYLYRHPGYKVVQEDEGRGVDVTLLHHDVGLVRTRREMRLASAPQIDPLRAMRTYNPTELKNEEVQVLGFGRTEKSMLGEELFEVRLRLVFCERGAWFHCMCGVAALRSGGAGAGTGARGVCSGDSGGPVLYRGAQLAVTSMGPLECAAGHQDPAEGATSVFTALYNYADLVNATIYDTEAALRMRIVPTNTGARLALPDMLTATAVALLAWPAR